MKWCIAIVDVSVVCCVIVATAFTALGSDCIVDCEYFECEKLTDGTRCLLYDTLTARAMCHADPVGRGAGENCHEAQLNQEYVSFWDDCDCRDACAGCQQTGPREGLLDECSYESQDDRLDCLCPDEESST